MNQQTQAIRGADLRVGDTINVWWGNDTVTAFRPYTGTLTDILGADARIASFARCPGGMTISADDTFPLVARMQS